MSHRHRCTTKDCPYYYVCTQRDCQIDWQCPSCEDNEHFSDIDRMNREQQIREMNRAENQ
jgi:hypothetical protein